METKNISGKIPVELHQRMWEELERTGMKVSDFLEKVIEEHFIKQEEEMRRKQESNEVTRTLAISVPDSSPLQILLPLFAAMSDLKCREIYVGNRTACHLLARWISMTYRPCLMTRRLH